MRVPLCFWVLPIWLPSCGGRVDAEPHGPSECHPALGEKLLRHACVHLENGPYTSIAASTSSEAPDVGKLHRAFGITVGTQSFYLKYLAARAGQAVLLTNAPVAWRVRDPDGNELEVRTDVTASQGFGTWTTCAGATHAAVVTLELGKEYVLLGAGAPERFTLFVEHAETFGNDAWAQSCPET
jgi:hypothetical protein